MPERLVEIVRAHEDPAVWEASWQRLYTAASARFSVSGYVRAFTELVGRLR